MNALTKTLKEPPFSLGVKEQSLVPPLKVSYVNPEGEDVFTLLLLNWSNEKVGVWVMTPNEVPANEVPANEVPAPFDKHAFWDAHNKAEYALKQLAKANAAVHDAWKRNHDEGTKALLNTEPEVKGVRWDAAWQEAQEACDAEYRKKLSVVAEQQPTIHRYARLLRTMGAHMWGGVLQHYFEARVASFESELVAPAMYGLMF